MGGTFTFETIIIHNVFPIHNISCDCLYDCFHAGIKDLSTIWNHHIETDAHSQDCFHGDSLIHVYVNGRTPGCHCLALTVLGGTIVCLAL